MRLVALLLVLASGIVLAAPVPGDFKKKTDPALLIQGTWVVIDCNVSGKASNGRPERLMKFDQETTQILDAGVVVVEHKYVLNTKEPVKRMIWTPKASTNRIYDCAYSLNADVLTISVGHEPTSAPASVEPGSGVTVYQLKRKPPQ